MKLKKKVFVVLTAAMLLAAPFSVYAATSDAGIVTGLRGSCGLGINISLTEEQKIAMEESFNQIIEVKKEAINNMVKDGTLTQEQGDQALERMNAMAEYHEENGYGVGMMNGMGNCQGTTENVGRGRGMMGARN